MITEKEVVRIGTLLKPHGVKGEITLSLLSPVTDQLEIPYFICLLDGIFVPFFVETIRDKGIGSALIKFKGVDSVEQARRFQGVKMFTSLQYASEIVEEKYTWESFIGFQVVDTKKGMLGKIESIDTTTLNILFFIIDTDKEIIIPANEEWIENIDVHEKVIKLSLPEGIVDLN